MKIKDVLVDLLLKEQNKHDNKCNINVFLFSLYKQIYTLNEACSVMVFDMGNMVFCSERCNVAESASINASIL